MRVATTASRSNAQTSSPKINQVDDHPAKCCVEVNLQFSISWLQIEKWNTILVASGCANGFCPKQPLECARGGARVSRVWIVTNIVLDGERLLRKNIIVCATDDVMKLRIVIGDVTKNTSCAKFALKQHTIRERTHPAGSRHPANNTIRINDYQPIRSHISLLRLLIDEPRDWTNRPSDNRGNMSSCGYMANDSRCWSPIVALR